MEEPEGDEGISKERATGNARKVCIDYMQHAQKQRYNEVTRFWLKGRLFQVVDM